MPTTIRQAHQQMHLNAFLLWALAVYGECRCYMLQQAYTCCGTFQEQPVALMIVGKAWLAGLSAQDALSGLQVY